jgi:hypothetical protein
VKGSPSSTNGLPGGLPRTKDEYAFGPWRLTNGSVSGFFIHVSLTLQVSGVGRLSTLPVLPRAPAHSSARSDDAADNGSLP